MAAKFAGVQAIERIGRCGGTSPKVIEKIIPRHGSFYIGWREVVRFVSLPGLEHVSFRSMMEFNDGRWNGLEGGYRVPFDPRPLLAKLEADEDTEAVWEELWQELHHQGDVGGASYAAVPHLVRILRKSGRLGWNTFAIVAIIELCRTDGKNPDLPDWLRDEYLSAIRDLAGIAQSQIARAHEPEETRAMLSIIAIEKGLREHGRFLVLYSEEELLDMDFRE